MMETSTPRLHPQTMADDQFQIQPQDVSAPDQIAGLLRRLMDAHALTRISLPEGSDSWLSAIIEVRSQEGYLLLDELTPQEGNTRVGQAQRVFVSAQVHGVDISFTSRILGQGKSDGALFFRVALPEQVRYWQKRASYRAQVSAATQIPVCLQKQGQPALHGELFDISSGGIGTRHRKHTGAIPLLGDFWEECCIKLPDGQDIRCALEIRFVSHDERHGTLRLGGRFVDITRPQLKLVENFVAALERERLRKARRSRDE